MPGCSRTSLCPLGAVQYHLAMMYRWLGFTTALVGLVALTADCGSDDCRKTLTCPTGASGEGGTGAGASSSGSSMGGGSGDKVAGETCGAPGECESGLCVDGVCCTAACDAACESCALTDSEGTCAPIAEGSDPEDECHGEAVCGSQSCAYATPLWAKVFASSQDENIEDMASSSAGAFVMVGDFESTLGFGGGVLNPGGGFVAQIGPSTSHNWSNAYPNNVFPEQVSVTVTGEVIVAGRYIGSPDLGGGAISSSFGYGFFILRLNAQGSHVQSAGFPGPSGNSPVLLDLDSDASGNAFVHGHTNKTVGWNMDSYNIPADTEFVATLAPNDAVAVMTTLPTLVNDITHGTSSFLTGDFQGALSFGSHALTATGDDLFLAKLTVGAWDWAFNFGSGRAEGLKVAAVSDDVVVAGTFQNTLPLGDIMLTASGDAAFVARFNAQGTPTWGVAIEGDFEPSELAIVSGDVVVAGEARGQVAVAGLGFEATSTGDLGFIKLTGDGTPVWAVTHGDPGTHTLVGLAASDDNVGFVGSFADQFNFAGESFPGMGADDIFFGILGP